MKLAKSVIQEIKEESDEEDMLVKCRNGLTRKMMDKEEIKLADSMVKKGLLHKGTSDDKQKSVTYYSEQ